MNNSAGACSAITVESPGSPERGSCRNGTGPIARWALAKVRTTGDLPTEGHCRHDARLAQGRPEFPVKCRSTVGCPAGSDIALRHCAGTSRREKSGARLLQQQIEQQVLLSLIPAMVWYKDSHNRILRANRRAAESLRKTVAEIEGVTPMSFILGRPSGIIRTI